MGAEQTCKSGYHSDPSIDVPRSEDSFIAKTRARAGCVRALRSQRVAPCAPGDDHGCADCAAGPGSHAWRGRSGSRSAAEGVPDSTEIIHAQVHQMVRDDHVRSSAACAHDSKTVCACARLADSTTIVMLFASTAGLLYDRARRQVLHFAAHEMSAVVAASAASRARADWLTARGQLAQAWGARRPRIACVRACLSCGSCGGSFAVRGLPVRVAAVDPMRVWVAVIGRGPEAARARRWGRLVGPNALCASLTSPGLFYEGADTSNRCIA